MATSFRLALLLTVAVLVLGCQDGTPWPLPEADVVPDAPLDDGDDFDDAASDLAAADADLVDDLADDPRSEVDVAPDLADEPGADARDASGDARDAGTPNPCTPCHGLGDNPAPPFDTLGNRSVQARGVGAHRQHLEVSSIWHADIACTECHLVPESIEAEGHIDTALPAELMLGPVASTAGADGGWDGERCSNTYCHGATLDAGGSVTNPLWTLVDSSQVACGSCHGVPPGPPHPADANCSQCHETMSGTFAFAFPERHIDGVLDVESVHPAGWAEPGQHGAAFNDGGLDACGTCHGADLTGGDSGVSCNTCHDGWRTDCVFCHGGQDNTTGAPPTGVDGEAARTVLAVGAHTQHVETTSVHIAFDCTRCHVVPGDALTTGHIDGDGRAEVVFDAFNPSGDYDGNGTCESLYCHGNGQTPDTSPLWTVDVALGCSSCHANQTTAASSFDLSGEHELHVLSKHFTCSSCHDGTANGNNVNEATSHVDGDADVQFASDIAITWSNGRCNGDCHGEEHENDDW